MRCPRCEYDLAAHSLGDICPECGTTIKRFLHWSPWLKRLGPISLASLVLVPLSIGIESFDPALPVWITSLVLFALLGVIAWLQIRLTSRFAIVSLGAVVLSVVVPIYTCALYLIVFVFDGDLGLWLTPWLVLFYGNLASFVVAFATFMAPPYRIRYVVGWSMPLLSMTMAALAVYFLGESIANA